MICRICNKKILIKCLYRHLQNHHTTLTKYFLKYPEDYILYEDYKKTRVAWNKGLTAKDHPSIAIYAKASKEYSNRMEVKKARSESLKKRYKEQGDILSPEQRQKVVKLGSDGWVKKVNSLEQKERTAILSKFTSAGNKAQEERRPSLTPEDYQKLYPFAKGEFVWYNCDYCGDKIIICSGGNRNAPRPRKNFCDKDCRKEFVKIHPNAILGNKRIVFNSKKMNKEMFLLSRLEEFIATIIDESDFVKTWDVCPFHIKYKYEGVFKKYYPDFLINGNLVIEVKSSYIFGLNAHRNEVKLREARKWCNKNNYIFEYWEFPNTNFDKVKNDTRVKRFLLGGD